MSQPNPDKHWKEHFAEAVTLVGSQQKMADKTGLSLSTIKKLQSTGKGSHKRMSAECGVLISQAVLGAKTLQELCPHLFKGQDADPLSETVT